MAWLSGYQHRRKITIDNSNIDTNLVHFPVPVPLGSAVGISSANITDIFDEVGSDFLQIAVTKADGDTQLYVEVTRWDDVNKKGMLWVSKDDFTVLSAETVDLYIYFDSAAANNSTYVASPGDRSEVWNPIYAAVLNFGESSYDGSTGEVIDSVGNITDMAQSMGSVSVTDGLLGGKTPYFNGGAQLAGALSLSSPFAISCFAKITGNDGNNCAVAELGYWDYKDGIGIWHHGRYGYFYGPKASHAYPGTTSTDWEQLVVSLDGSGNFKELESLTQIKSASSVSSQTVSGIYVGRRGGGSEGIIGTITFLRYYNCAPSEEWMKADYYGQTDNLLTFSAAETENTIKLEDASLDFSVWGRKLDDLSSFFRVHDGLELRDFQGAFEAAGWNIEDFASFLSAYYANMDDAKTNLETWATKYGDFAGFLSAYYQHMEDAKTKLETWATRYADAKAPLEAADWKIEDLGTWLATNGQSLASVSAILQAGQDTFKNLALFLDATNGIKINDMGCYLYAHNGIIERDASLYLRAIASVPVFKSTTVQRVSSVVSEVV